MNVTRQKVMVIMDGFCSYHSGYLEQRIQELFPDTVIILHVVSDYLYRYLQLHPPTPPPQSSSSLSSSSSIDDVTDDQPSLPTQRPTTLDEVHAWLQRSGIHDIHNRTNTTTTTTMNTNIIHHHPSSSSAVAGTI